MSNLVPTEIDLLIKEYLTDGVITDRERKAILRKAKRLELDVDEVDLYIDAQIQKLNNKNTPPPLPSPRTLQQQEHKCPFCGANLPDITDKCPQCDSFITPKSSEELNDIIDKLEEALVNLKSSDDFARSNALVERYARKARLYYSNNPKIIALLEEVNIELPKAKSKAKRRAVWAWICKHPILTGFIILVLVCAIICIWSPEAVAVVGFIGLVLLGVVGMARQE